MISLSRLLCFSLFLIGAVLPTPVGTPAQTLDAKSKGTGLISGRVTVGDKPAPGIMVVVMPGNGYNRETPVGQGTTDADGNYRISKVPSGQFTIVPIAPVFVVPREFSSFGGKTLVLLEAETVEGIDFKLTRGGVITGRVTDENNRPAIEERVVISPVDEKGGPARMQMSLPSNYQMYQTDDRGVFRVYGLPAGRYTISVGNDSNTMSFGTPRSGFYQRTYHPDVTDPARATIVEIGEGTEAKDIDIKLGRRAPTFTVSGRIVDAETSQPFIGAGVGLGIVRTNNGEDYVGGTIGGAPTNARGEFKLQGLEPGRYTVSIQNFSGDRGLGVYCDPVLFEIVDSDVANLELKAIRGSSLVGVVVLDGAASKDAAARLSRVTIFASVAKPGNLQIPSGAGSAIGAGGSFQINGLRPGKLTIRLYGQQSQYPIMRIERDGVRQDQGVEIQAGENISGVRVVAAYGKGVIRGQVKFEGGTLPAGTPLWVGVTREGVAMDRGVQVDTRGRFLVDALPAGTYELTLQGNFYGPPKRGERRPPPPKQIATLDDGSEVEVVFTVDLGQKKETP